MQHFEKMQVHSSAKNYMKMQWNKRRPHLIKWYTSITYNGRYHNYTLVNEFFTEVSGGKLEVHALLKWERQLNLQELFHCQAMSPIWETNFFSNNNLLLFYTKPVAFWQLNI